MNTKVTSFLELSLKMEESKAMEGSEAREESKENSITVQPKSYLPWIQNLPMRILEAKKRIESSVRKTPLEYSMPLSKMGSDCKVYLKLESEQVTGSFKVRGAFNKLLLLIRQSSSIQQTGAITASTGNHGKACLHAGKILGVPLQVYCREDVDETKKNALIELGAEVILFGKDCVDAENQARKTAKEKNVPYISPYNDHDIIAGQGTIGLEMIEELPDVDVCLVPVGGGGLIGGIARYLKQMSPKVKVVGCQPSKSKVMYECVKADKIVFEESEETLSDGTVGGVEKDSLTFDLCKHFIDEWILVDEEQIGKAVVYMMEKHHKIVEGAAGVGLAAYMNNTAKFSNKNVVIVCCGANISAAALKRLLNIYQ